MATNGFARIKAVDGKVHRSMWKDGMLKSLEAESTEGFDDRSWLDLVMRGGEEVHLTHAEPLDHHRVEWLLPVARPGKIICLGLNYAAHAAEGGNAAPEYPAFFFRGATSLIPHGAPLIRPRVSDKLDFEAELAVVIGRAGRHLTESNALDVVAGYTCFNDGTLRDYQRKASQWTIGKNFDGTGALGPWLVSARDLPAGAAGLRIESLLNGKVMQSDDTSNMIVTVQQALVLLSEVMTLEPGDIIAMGTPSGVGYARKPPVFMQEGDQIEISISGIGVLTNQIAREP